MQCWFSGLDQCIGRIKNYPWKIHHFGPQNIDATRIRKTEKEVMEQNKKKATARRKLQW